jgi:hypothetical protein
MINRLRHWLIFKVVGNKPIIANLPFPISIPSGEYRTNKTILIKNLKEH